MKKVLIFYAAYGGGHLSAAKSLKEYIDKNYENYEAEIVDCMQYVNKSFDKIAKKAYIEMATRLPWLWGKIYQYSQKGLLAAISSKTNAILAIKLLKLLKKEEPEIIICTHPFASQMCGYLKKKNKISAKIATVMTDFAPHDQWLIESDFQDYFFVANDDMKQYLIEKKIAENKVYTTGIPIALKFLAKYDKKEILEEFGFKENKKTILFFAGGGLGLVQNTTLEVFETLIKDFEDTQIIGVAGKNAKTKSEFEKIVINNNRENNVKIFEFTDKVPELMTISDLIVSKPGGLTVSESLAMNLPIMIINPIPGQEEENARFLESKNCGKWIKNKSEAKEIFEKILLDDSQLEKIKENTKAVAKKYATENVCKIIFN